VHEMHVPRAHQDWHRVGQTPGSNSFRVQCGKIRFCTILTTLPIIQLYGKNPVMPDACMDDGTEALQRDVPDHVAALQQRLAWASHKLTTVRNQLKEKNKAY